MFLDSALARRIESAEALNAAACGESITVAGGRAVFSGIGSPLTHAVGLGMNGPVSDAEFERMEEFFRARGLEAVVEACPHADSSLFESMGRRGYSIVECSNVMIGPVVGADDARARQARPEEADLWSRVMIEGFFSRADLTRAELDQGSKMFRMPEGTPWFGLIDGAPAAAGVVNARDGLALLFADSTLPRARGQGLHLALIRARLKHAAKLGCNLATAAATPGSVSQRNYERAGFGVAYTRLSLHRTLTEQR